jgi:hypothetical protein
MTICVYDRITKCPHRHMRTCPRGYENQEKSGSSPTCGQDHMQSCSHIDMWASDGGEGHTSRRCCLWRLSIRHPAISAPSCRGRDSRVARSDGCRSSSATSVRPAFSVSAKAAVGRGAVRDFGTERAAHPYGLVMYGLVMAIRGRPVTAALSPDDSGPRTGKCVSVRVLSAQSDGADAAIAMRLTGHMGTAEQPGVPRAGWRTLAGPPVRRLPRRTGRAFAWTCPAGGRAMGRAPGLSGAFRPNLSRLRPQIRGLGPLLTPP